MMAIVTKTCLRHSSDAMDSHGESIYQEVKSEVASNKEAVLRKLGIV